MVIQASLRHDKFMSNNWVFIISAVVFVENMGWGPKKRKHFV